MDFVVVGFGIGSICILAGLVLRDAPGWWDRLPRRRPTTEGDANTARLCRAFGNVILVAGIALSMVTLAALFSGFSDSAGALLVASAVTIIAIGLVGWAIRWRQRFPPPRRRIGQAALAAAPLPLAVAIERGLAREQAVTAGEADETIEASGLTVERTVTAQERGEHKEPIAEAASGEHEAGERHATMPERHHAVVARAVAAVEPSIANAGAIDDRLGQSSGEPAASAGDPPSLSAGESAGQNAAVASEPEAPAPATDAPAAADKSRDG
ncbi:MAG TPA: hypothetical protein VFI22_17965 [Thermomicrobiales bacterium]|nr:hypothetical protein [Thermomicrobiales bacterium]